MSAVTARVSIAPDVDPLTLARAVAMVREATKDKSFLELPLGREVGRYLRARRKQLTAISYHDYEGTLAKFALQFADKTLADFELPGGVDLLEPWLDDMWGAGSAAGYNVRHSHLASFFDWHVKRQHMQSNPMRLIDRAKKRDMRDRTTFADEQRQAILAACSDRRDRLALRLLLDYGLRKGSMQRVQFKHFDHQRRRLTVFLKGGKIRALPVPDPHFWMDLERHILDVEAQPTHYLMCVVKPVPYGSPDRAGHRPTRLHRFPDRAMSATAMHRWWYRQLENAGIVAHGDTSGERMHKARHTAAQRLLDKTGDLKAVQKLLGHSSLVTTADVYVDYDLAQLADKIAQALEDE